MYYDDYYPFDLTFNQSGDRNNKYLYQGKERQEELGLNWDDFDNRFYQPDLGRFTTIDKLAGHPNQIGMSPYSAMWNNPISLTDPDGNCPICPIIEAAVDIGFTLYDAGEIAYQYATTGTVDPISVAALGADATAIVVPFATGAGLGVRAAAKTATVIDNAVDAAKAAENTGAVLKRNNARQLLEKRGVPKEGARDVVNSLDGDIIATQGKKGDIFTITETSKGSASGNFVTRGNPGKTAAERRQNLALPPSNTAERVGKVKLLRDQILLEGKVAPNFGDKKGGDYQVITDGGRRNKAIEDID